MSPTAPQPAVTVNEGVQTPEWHRFARYAAALGLATGAVVAVLLVAPVANVIVVGALLAIVTGAGARSLVRRTGIRFIHAVLIVYAILIAATVLLAVTAFPWLQQAFSVLLAALNATYPSVGAILSGGQPTGSPAVQKLELVFTTTQIQKAAQVLIGWVIDLLTALFSGLATAVYVGAVGLFLSFLMRVDLGDRGFRPLDRLSGGYRREARLLVGRLAPLWVRYLGAEALYGVILAAASLVEYALLGVPYPILMALLTGLISLIPSVGGLLASLVVAVPCLLFGSTKLTGMSPLAFTVLVTAINIVITQVSYNFILLPILGKAVKLPISVVLIGVLVGFAMNSVLFAFLVVPVLASLRILVAYVIAKIRSREPFPDDPMVAAP